MLTFDDNLFLKIVAWLFYCPFYIYALIVKFCLSKKRHVTVYAPQQPRVVVVTGASQGIGEGLVEYYCRNCPTCEIIIVISRSKEKLEKVKERFDTNSQKKLLIYACDVTHGEEMKSILSDIHQTYGQVDILFANAGVSFRQLSENNSFDKAVRDAFNINVSGVINTIMPLIELKAVRQIVIISSQAAYAPVMSPIYGTTKQCVLSFGLDLRHMLAKHNIAVNVVSPGPVVTPMLLGSNPRSVSRGVSVNEAARIIADGIRRNQAEIVFPATTGIFMYLLQSLPTCLAEAIAFHLFVKN
ncbi:unnamed protein product [Adineta ricciae]|uniref:Uncharacterized protein n=1 Tax=Adineta ricciae TaxID=249248 RepID=A0A816BPS4_ADIRI|nr:unnamed protein product [Adineta ricciae]